MYGGHDETDVDLIPDEKHLVCLRVLTPAEAQYADRQIEKHAERLEVLSREPYRNPKVFSIPRPPTFFERLKYLFFPERGLPKYE